jgi:hypothetical protein
MPSLSMRLEKKFSIATNTTAFASDAINYYNSLPVNRHADRYRQATQCAMVHCPGQFLQAPANAQHPPYSTSEPRRSPGTRDTRRFKLLSLSDLSRRRRASQMCDE